VCNFPFQSTGGIRRKMQSNNQETGCFISHGNRFTFRMGYLKKLSFEIPHGSARGNNSNKNQGF